MISASKTQITYQCDGVTTQFSFPYAYYDKAHVVGFLIDGAGKETKITTNCDFDEVNKKFIYPVSGTAIAAPNKIKLKRVTELSQLLDLPDEHPYGNIEKAQDKLTMIMQELTYVGETSIPDIEASLQEQLNNVIDNKTAAAASEAAAKASETAAAASVTAAQTAQTAAEAAKTAAQTAEAEVNATIQDAVNTAVSSATASAAASANSASSAESSASVATEKASESAASASTAIIEANRVEQLVTSKTIPVPCMPVGVPFPWLSSTRPDGTLLCDGSAFSTTTYPELAKVFPTGVLPDLRGVVPRGLDRGRGLDTDGVARAIGSYQGDAIRNITGTFGEVMDGSNTGVTTGAFSYTTTSNRWAYSSNGNQGKITFDASKQVPTGAENRMKNIAVDWLVYAVPVVYDVAVQNANAATIGGYSASHFLAESDVTERIKSNLNVAGTAPMFACRAWVNFNGVGTLSIRASGNVSSITDNGVGDYTINFATQMPDANYAIVGMINAYGAANAQMCANLYATNMDGTGVVKTAQSVRVLTATGSTGGLLDTGNVNFAVFR